MFLLYVSAVIQGKLHCTLCEKLQKKTCTQKVLLCWPALNFKNVFPSSGKLLLKRTFSSNSDVILGQHMVY